LEFPVGLLRVHRPPMEVSLSEKVVAKQPNGKFEGFIICCGIASSFLVERT
jgi:hypothetical protein